MEKLEKLEKFLLNKTLAHCEIDKFYFDRLIEYQSSLCDYQEATYEGFIEYIHSFIDNELSAIGYDINKNKENA